MHRLVTLEEHVMLLHQSRVAFLFGDLVPDVWFDDRPA